MKTLLMVALIVVSFQGFAASLNDYSLLLPLPTTEEMSELLSPASAGTSGELLKQNFYRQLPSITVPDDPSLIYERLRVVAIRLDPCFAEGAVPMACRRQIRMVWQPLVESRGQMLAADAALHSFYDLSEAQWSQLLVELAPFSVGTDRDPLQIHPGILRHRYQSAYWRGLRSVILKYAGDQSLTRVTFMTVNPMGNVWVFGAFDVEQGQMKRLKIPIVNFEAQGFFIDKRAALQFVSEIRPQLMGQNNFIEFLADSAKFAQSKTNEELREVIRLAYDLENPRRHNPGTVDCVSCHMAQSLRQWGTLQNSSWTGAAEFEKEQFQSPLNLSNLSSRGFNQDQMRAFGYFGSEAVISGRAINETAQVFSSLHPDGALPLGRR